MILDITIVVFVLLLAFIGLKRGIAKTLYGVICIAAAGILAYLGGRLLAELIYNNLILKSITESIKTSFESAAVSSGNVSNGIFDSIPNFLSGILISLGITQKGFATTLDTASDFSQKAATAAVDKVISPVIISVLSFFIIILLFIIIFLILKFVVGRQILKIFKLPVINWINSLLGFIFGFCEGALIVFIVITIIRISAFFADSSFISKELIDSSLLFNSIY
ncbi:MAG: CvpA family protein [Ruminococcus sp.]|nr:CvpA family protein [Ruminococcus sp.]